MLNDERVPVLENLELSLMTFTFCSYLIDQFVGKEPVNTSQDMCGELKYY